LREPVYGILGNHDTIRMVPALEGLGIRMLINESDTLSRCDDRIHLAGIDDAHFFRAENIDKASELIPDKEFSILLSHTPEIYRQAAAADRPARSQGIPMAAKSALPGSILIA
jgi:hypothetical protein